MGIVSAHTSARQPHNAKIWPMNLSEIVVQLKNERSRLDAAIQALEGLDRNSGGGISGGGKRRGRPPGSVNKPAAGGPKKRRGMSTAARKRIAEAMRKRWASAKKSGKKRL
jgi:hypothetical protein